MILVDVILLVLLLGFVAQGWRDGLVKTLGHLVGAVIGFVVARAWCSLVGAWLGHLIPLRQGVLQFLAFILIFLIIDRLVGLLVALLDKVFKIVAWLPIIAQVQKLIGAFFGLIEGMIAIGAAAYVITSARLDASLIGYVTGSHIASFCQYWFRFVIELFS